MSGRVVSSSQFGPLHQQDAYRAPYHDELEAAARDSANFAPEPDDYYEADYDDDYDYDYED